MVSNRKFLPESYSPLEQQRIDELRESLSDLDLEKEFLVPSQLIRWLRARNLDVGKAAEMLRKHLEWRIEHNVDGILDREQLPDEFKRITPTAYAGVDNEGYPILIVPVGRRDLRPLLDKLGIEKCSQVNILFCELVTRFLRRISEEQGRPVTQMTQILDMEGFNYRQFASKICRDYTTQSQTTFNDNYPEVLRYAMIINAPKAFHVIWNIFKPFIPKQTQEKMEIFGTDKRTWMTAIAEKFPLADIPPHWGGTRQGEDEYCSNDSKLWVLGSVSRSFFSFGKPYLTDDDENSSQIVTKTIAACDSLKIRLSVTIPNSSITWRFRAENHDIGFQVLDEVENELVPYKKVKCQKEHEEGELQCKMMGIYTVIFDNSYSWTRSKTISYKVSVVGGEQDNGKDT